MSLNIVCTPAGPGDGSHHARGLGDCQEVLAHATSPWSTQAPGFTIALFVFNGKLVFVHAQMVDIDTLVIFTVHKVQQVQSEHLHV